MGRVSELKNLFEKGAVSPERVPTSTPKKIGIPKSEPKNDIVPKTTVQEDPVVAKEEEETIQEVDTPEEDVAPNADVRVATPEVESPQETDTKEEVTESPVVENEETGEEASAEEPIPVKDLVEDSVNSDAAEPVEDNDNNVDVDDDE